MSGPMRVWTGIIILIMLAMVGFIAYVFIDKTTNPPPPPPIIYDTVVETNGNAGAVTSMPLTEHDNEEINTVADRYIFWAEGRVCYEISVIARCVGFDALGPEAVAYLQAQRDADSFVRPHVEVAYADANQNYVDYYRVTDYATQTVVIVFNKYRGTSEMEIIPFHKVVDDAARQKLMDALPPIR